MELLVLFIPAGSEVVQAFNPEGSRNWELGESHGARHSRDENGPQLDNSEGSICYHYLTCLTF